MLSITVNYIVNVFCLFNYILPPILISSIVSQMNQYCKTKRKTIVLQMNISGKSNQDQLYVAGSDNHNDLDNLGGDSDMEFIPVTEKAREAPITSGNNIEVEDTTSTTGDVQ